MSNSKKLKVQDPRFLILVQLNKFGPISIAYLISEIRLMILIEKN